MNKKADTVEIASADAVLIDKYAAQAISYLK